MTVWVVIAAFVIIDAAGVWWFVKRGLPRIHAINTTPQDVVAFELSPAATATVTRGSFVGGGTIGGVSVGRGLMRLELSPAGVTMGPRWTWVKLIPSVNWAWEQLERVVIRDTGFVFTRFPSMDFVVRGAAPDELLRFTPRRREHDTVVGQVYLARPGLLVRAP